MSAKKRITVTVDKAPFEVCRTHGLNVSDICNQAIIRQSEFIRQDKTIEEQISELREKQDYLLRIQDKQQQEEEVREKTIGAVSEREEEVMGTIKRMYEIHGFLSKPSIHILCTQKQVNFDDIWLKLPAEWTAEAKHFSYDDLTANKPHTDYDGRTTKTNQFG